jgi:hypothetical protein
MVYNGTSVIRVNFASNRGRFAMLFSTRNTIGALMGAACLAALAAPASAGTLSVAPLKDVAAGSSQVTDVAYRARHTRTARHVTVRRHYVGHRRYAGYRRVYYRRHNAFPAVALGLFAGALGAAAWDDCGYGYGYGGGCGYYPSYSYGYDYPYTYSYGYAQPRYYRGYRGGFAGRGFYRGGYNHGYRGGFVGQRFGGGRIAGVRGGGYGGGMRVGGGGGGMRGGGGGGHRR